MSARPRRAEAPAAAGRLAGAALLATALAAAPVRAMVPGDVDDPKVARRLRPIAPAVERSAAVPVGASSAASTPGGAAPTPAQPASTPAPAIPASASAADGGAAEGADVAPAPGKPWVATPRAKLSYRRFTFLRIGAVDADSASGAAAPEDFGSLVLDLYPFSSFLRLGLSSQFGWESGGFNRSGDYFLAQSFSLGFQRPGRVTPFVEALAGAGYMRRRQFDMTIPTAYWQLGLDAGAEVYFMARAYLSFALGYLHPVNGFLVQRDFTTVYADTWSLKIGIGM